MTTLTEDETEDAKPLPPLLPEAERGSFSVTPPCPLREGGRGLGRMRKVSRKGTDRSDIYHRIGDADPIDF